jgi:hypothetical protein
MSKTPWQNQFEYILENEGQECKTSVVGVGY